MLDDILLSSITKKYQELSDALSNGNFADGREFAAVSKEYAELGPIVGEIKKYFELKAEVAVYQEMQNDVELYDTACKELSILDAKIVEISEEIKILLLPKDKDDARNVVMEIRSGTGGDEAELFVGDLCRMYEQFSTIKGWKFTALSKASNNIGGYKEVVIEIKGSNVFANLRFESGVHRVQRVPVTETSGRLHTSTATVAVLPEAEEVDVVLDAKDLRIDFYRSSGPGGQSVNTTDSAVRITHIPSGIVVTQQDEKSQHKNKSRAMQILRTRLYNKEKEEKDMSRMQMRKAQTGSGERCERIRTYNFPQNRITDHRLSESMHNISQVIDEGKLGIFTDKLIAHHKAQLLADAQNTESLQ